MLYSLLIRHEGFFFFQFGVQVPFQRLRMWPSGLTLSMILQYVGGSMFDSWTATMSKCSLAEQVYVWGVELRVREGGMGRVQP